MLCNKSQSITGKHQGMTSIIILVFYLNAFCCKKPFIFNYELKSADFYYSKSLANVKSKSIGICMNKEMIEKA